MGIEINTALLISGSGTTAEAILQARKKGELDGINPLAVIASRPDADGIQKVQRLGVATYVVNRRLFPNSEEFGNALLALLNELHVDFISQNGWLPKMPEHVIAQYPGRIINQHPGPLDPGRIDFGGKGMYYGIRVSAARLGYAWLTNDAQEHWTEATIHHVTQEYDTGGLIAVSRLALPEFGCPVIVAELTASVTQSFIEGARDLQASLLEREHELAVETLRTIGSTRSIPIYQRDQQLVPDRYIPLVDTAKHVALQTFPRG